MDNNNLKKEVIQIIYDLFFDFGFDIEQFDALDLINDLGMDSVTYITLIVELETRFNITIPDEQLLMENFSCADRIISLIAQELNIE